MPTTITSEKSDNNPTETILTDLQNFFDSDKETNKATVFVLDHGNKNILKKNIPITHSDFLKAICSEKCKEILFFVDTCKSVSFIRYIELIKYFRQINFGVNDFCECIALIKLLKHEDIFLIKQLFARGDSSLSDLFFTELTETFLLIWEYYHNDDLQDLKNKAETLQFSEFISFISSLNITHISQLQALVAIKNNIPRNTDHHQFLLYFKSFLEIFECSILEHFQDFGDIELDSLKSYVPPQNINIAAISSTSCAKYATVYNEVQYTPNVKIILGSIGISDFVAAILTHKGTIHQLFEYIKEEIANQTSATHIPIYVATSDYILNLNVSEFFPLSEIENTTISYDKDMIEINQILNEIHKTGDETANEMRFLDFMKSRGYLFFKISNRPYFELRLFPKDYPDPAARIDEKTLRDYEKMEITDARFMPKPTGRDEDDDKMRMLDYEKYDNDGKEVSLEFFIRFNRELFLVNRKAVPFVPFNSYDFEIYGNKENNWLKFIECIKSIPTRMFYLRYFFKTRLSFSYYLSQNLKEGNDYYHLIRKAWDDLMKYHNEREFIRYEK